MPSRPRHPGPAFEGSRPGQGQELRGIRASDEVNISQPYRRRRATGVSYGDDLAHQPFSKRHNFRGPAPEITIWDAAPESLRATMLEAATDAGFGPASLRSVICRVLRVRANISQNWSEYPNIWEEVQDLVYGAEWFKVYDIMEAIYGAMSENDDRRYLSGGDRPSMKFAEELNAEMVDTGIGWQLVNGEVITRGAEAFQSTVAEAVSALNTTGRPTAASHIHDAILAMSRRPEPDLSGAIFHAMGALEAVARALVADEKATLGEILKRYPDFVPSPLDKALSQIWGFASNEARHVVEGRNPTREETELIVGLAASVATYLCQRRSKI